MQQHFAEEGTFRSKTGNAAGPQPVFVARRTESDAVAVDTHGKLQKPNMRSRGLAVGRIVVGGDSAR